MSQNVGNLDEITRQNGALVENPSASHELVERAQMLSSAGVIDPPAPERADEARDLVERDRTGAARGLGRGLRPIRDRSQGFVDRDLYVFAVDRSRTGCMPPNRPAKAKRVHDIPASTATASSRTPGRAPSAARAGSSTTSSTSETGKVRSKASYVHRLDADRLVG